MTTGVAKPTVKGPVLLRRNSIVNRFSRINKRRKGSFLEGIMASRLGPCPPQALVGDYHAGRLYAPSEVECWRLRGAEKQRRGGQPQTSRRAPRFVAGGRVVRDQSFSRCKIDSATDSGADPGGGTGVELQAESPGAVPSAAAELYDRRRGTGNQRGLCGPGHVRH